MGCRPSRQALGRVADSTWAYNRSYIQDVDKKKHKNKKSGTNGRRKTPIYSDFSSTSKTYFSRDSRKSKITVRLSTDGSMLEVEEFYYDIKKLSSDEKTPELSESDEGVKVNGHIKPHGVRRCDSAPQLASVNNQSNSRSTQCVKSSTHTELLYQRSIQTHNEEYDCCRQESNWCNRETNTCTKTVQLFGDKNKGTIVESNTITSQYSEGNAFQNRQNTVLGKEQLDANLDGRLNKQVHLNHIYQNSCQQACVCGGDELSARLNCPSDNLLKHDKCYGRHTENNHDIKNSNRTHSDIKQAHTDSTQHVIDINNENKYRITMCTYCHNTTDTREYRCMCTRCISCKDRKKEVSINYDDKQNQLTDHIRHANNQNTVSTFTEHRNTEQHNFEKTEIGLSDSHLSDRRSVPYKIACQDRNTKYTPPHQHADDIDCLPPVYTVSRSCNKQYSEKSHTSLPQSYIHKTALNKHKRDISKCNRTKCDLPTDTELNGLLNHCCNCGSALDTCKHDKDNISTESKETTTYNADPLVLLADTFVYRRTNGNVGDAESNNSTNHKHCILPSVAPTTSNINDKYQDQACDDDVYMDAIFSGSFLLDATAEFTSAFEADDVTCVESTTDDADDTSYDEDNSETRFLVETDDNDEYLDALESSYV